MIQSFRHRGLKRFYRSGDRSGIRPDLLPKVERVLTVLDNATSIRAADLPGYRLHALRGGLAGFHSITVSANWRIVFRFEAGEVYDVDLVDYH